MHTCGHTMGTPKLDAIQAMELFASIGHDGIEFRCAVDGQMNPEAYDSHWGGQVFEKAQALGIEVACLTPYYKNYVDPALRASEIQGMCKIIDIAAELKCPRVRSYGGVMPTDAFDYQTTWDRTVSGIRQAADYAAPKGIDICIETHIGSLTLTAADTVRMVRAVDRENVGILFDYAWVHYAGQETAEEAVELCAPYIRHCHVKDWTYEEGDRDKRRSALMGEGDVDWRPAIEALRETGYTGCLSDEYEKYWYDHLPEPEVGMKHNLEYVRSLWEK